MRMIRLGAKVSGILSFSGASTFRYLPFLVYFLMYPVVTANMLTGEVHSSHMEGSAFLLQLRGPTLDDVNQGRRREEPNDSCNALYFTFILVFRQL
ncbi:hypothetical protein F9C07_1069757 [Aspergillus flavus]|uniref:Uncharacterized protein n=1 Tax=Aspergillus flavus (strain ATCC 200026 / FGSC A1120 / IAM 13836 / NRRL 3357 / JCM 12722 / SRRC 167) TaxID=332952 RepID=A0A7U2MQQ6_ASPFN|nr:hypothetical protein F9C07_1069757 [Aspergillus flavus]